MQGRLARYKLDIPNEHLDQWFRGPECRNAVQRYTSEIFTAYHNLLPSAGSVSKTGYVRTGRLKASAYWRVALADEWGTGGVRWFGYIGNRAPYAPVIEYGSRKRGIKGQRQLQRAVAMVNGRMSAASQVVLGGMASTPGLNNASSPMLDTRINRYRDSRGRFVKKPG